MKQLKDSVWQRRGISWLWDSEALSLICDPLEVMSLRQFTQLVGNWPDELPSNDGKTLVVAGLDACLDLLSPHDAEEWLAGFFKDALISFRDFADGDGALSFWLPGSSRRIKANPATDAVTWHCAAPHSDVYLDFGRLLWGEAREYPQEIVLRDGASSSGLFHLRIT